LAVLDLTAENTIAALGQLHSHAPDCRLILWTDWIATPLQALDLGVRGILRKNLPIEAHRQCQYTVAEGQFWLEKSLIARLLSDRK
jgi:DNA-binding NarL/FixJ family response regulator